MRILKMKKTIRAIILFLMLLAATLLATACSEKTPYDTYDEEGYTVSIKYDANGGMFTTNVDTIVDTYNISELSTNANGKIELALLSPDDPVRGTGNAFHATNAGHFLAGWYQTCTPVVNAAGEALDEDGNVAATSGKDPAYIYSGRWDFENGRMEIDPNAEHTAKESITLYAAWIPEFKYEFYSLDTGDLLGSYLFDPNYVSEIPLPQWSETSGKLDMKNFPTVTGQTFEAVYLDPDGEVAVNGTVVEHTGTYHAENATADDPVMKLYLSYQDGEWFRIYTAKQFIDNARAGGCYEILADLDFTGLIWPTSLMHGNFSGQIHGNGHTFSNITLEQTDTRKVNTGLFGQLTATAVLQNLNFHNISVTISKGTLQQDAAFGLFAGTVAEAATLTDIMVTESKLQINVAANLEATTDIGLFCGVGSLHGMDLSGMQALLIGEEAENYELTVDGNTVTVAEKQTP